MLKNEEVFASLKVMMGTFCTKTHYIASLDESDQERTVAKAALRRDIAEVLESLPGLEEQVLDDLKKAFDNTHKMQIMSIRLSQAPGTHRQVYEVTCHLARENVRFEFEHQKAFAFVRAQVTQMLKVVEAS
jgi:DNA-binding transcriptional regulator GbsR (MarR family)